jgi:hypothetical protein
MPAGGNRYFAFVVIETTEDESVEFGVEAAPKSILAMAPNIFR